MISVAERIDLDELAARIGELPAMPSVVLELLDSINDPDVNVEALAARIGHDQVMTARVLRLANSSFYGVPGRIGLVSEAVAILGLRTVRSVALSARITCAFPAGRHQEFLHFWRHTMGAALCARALAPRFGVDEDGAFTAGLLHDLGRMALSSCFPALFEATRRHQREQGCTPLQAERAVMGLDHTQAGRVLARCWNFSPAMSDVMALHHDAEPLPSPTSLPSLIHLADHLSHAMGLSGEEAEVVPPLRQEVWHAAGLEPDVNEKLFHKVDGELRTLVEALGL